MLADDLEKMGVQKSVAAAFTAVTATPKQSIQPQTKTPAAKQPPVTTFQTVDGSTISEAEVRRLLAIANPSGAAVTLGASPNVTYPTVGDIVASHGGDTSGFTGIDAPGATGYDPSTNGKKSVNPPLDWNAYLTNWGFEPGDVAELDKIFKTYSDPSQASAAGLAYIRGTDWYARTFAGIGAGIKAGLFSDEAGYRAYVNDLNQTYQRYFNRDVTSDEVQGLLGKGTNPNAVNAHLSGQATVNAQRGDIQYALGAFDNQGQASESELSDYGDQLAGLGNMVGPQLQARLDKARQRMASVFQGTLASPSLSMVMGRPTATSFGTDISKPDVAS